MSRRMRPLVYGPQDWADVKEHYQDREAWDDETIGDDCMAEDYDRAIDEIAGMYSRSVDADLIDAYDSRFESNDINDPPF